MNSHFRFGAVRLHRKVSMFRVHNGSCRTCHSLSKFRNAHQLTRNVSLGTQLHGRRHSGGKRPQRAVPVHAGHGWLRQRIVLREPLERPGPFRWRGEPPVPRAVGALCPAAGVAALLLPLTSSGAEQSSTCTWGQRGPLPTRAFLQLHVLFVGRSCVGVHVRIVLDVLGGYIT